MTRANFTFGLTAGLLAGLLTASASAQGGQSGLHREGDAWVETTSGSEALGEGEQLKIICLGNVTVRGGSRSQIEYTIKRRMRVHSEAQAREALQEAGVNLTRQGRFIRLVVNDATGPVDLQVTVPRILRSVLIGTDAGNIEVSDIDGAATAQTGGGNIRVGRVKGNVDLNTAGGTLDLGDVGGSARAVTAGGDIKVESVAGEARFETAGGNITVQKAGGGVRANTAGGSVRIAQAGGAVVADTAGGTIDIGGAGGTVTAHNAGGGPIVVGMAKGGVHCESASGAIKVTSSDGIVRLATASGSIIVQLDGTRLGGDSFVSTGSGDITVFIPANLGLTIHAQIEGATRSQSIVSDFPGLQIRFDGGASATARGTINGGGPNLQLEGNSGTISIRKR